MKHKISEIIDDVCNHIDIWALELVFVCIIIALIVELVK